MIWENDKSSRRGGSWVRNQFCRYLQNTAFSRFVGMIAQCIMVLCEGIIIGNGLGTEGLACVELIMPMEYLMLALGGFFAIGISTIAGIRLGKRGPGRGKKGIRTRNPVYPAGHGSFCPRLSLYLQALWRI